MLALILSIVWLALAFVLHGIWFRMRRPKVATKSILFFFIGTLILVDGYAVTALLDHYEWLHFVAQLSRFHVFALVCTMVYPLAITGVTNEGCTARILRLTAAAGEKGISLDELRLGYNSQQFLGGRIDEMVVSGWAQKVSGRYELTGKGRFFLKLFMLPRHLTGETRD